MNGNTLVAHLQSLEVPGAESLDGADYDWIFHANDTAPVTNFLEWFIKNVSLQDLITDAELNEYNKLKEKGEVATGQQLDEMESFLSGVPSSMKFSNKCIHPPISEEEQKRFEDQLQLLNKRKDHLSMHKMSLREEVRRCNKIVEETGNELRRQQEALLLASHHHSNVEQDFTKTLDSFIGRICSFDKTPPEEAQFLAQLNLEEWQEEETKFTQTLKAYMRKQFPKNVRVLAGEEDKAEYYLLEPGNVFLYLVRGEDQAKYTHNAQQLDRITKLWRQTEEWRLDGLVLQARRKAEIEEADRMLAAIQINQLPSTFVLLQKQLGETQAAVAGVRSEWEEQRRVMSELVEEVSQLAAISTISCNYQLKLQRQTYFLTRQNLVLKQLVSQVARYNWVTMTLNMEWESIKDILQLLLKFNSIMVERSNNSKERMEQLKAMTEDIENQKACGQLPPPLQTLSQLLPSPSKQQKVVTGKTLGTQIDTFQKSLSLSLELVSTSKNPQFSRLDKMSSLCEALEICLFGHPGSLRTLPEAWLEEGLAENCLTVENHAYKLKYKLLHLLRQHDERKKILLVDPTAREEEKTWTSKLIMALE